MSRIAARGWGWRHAGRQAWAVRGADFVIEPGERVLLLGPSGAGKSTLLSGIAGLLDGSEHGNGDEEGTLTVGGLPARRARLQAVRSGAGEAATGLLLQDPSAQTVLSRCGDDVAFGLENHGLAADQIWPRVRDSLHAVDLRVDLAHPSARLSGGQQQRLALAGVLALQPGVLLLDEPTAMLDADGGSRLREVVRHRLIDSQTTAVIVEHRVAEWVDAVDRVVVLEPGGGVMADGNPAEVLGAHGASLAAQGVWVPGHDPSARGAAVSAAGPAAGGAVMLQARDLAVTRPHRVDPVLTGVDLDVESGVCTALLGANGSGKSTLLLALGGLAAPARGTLHATPALADGLDPAPIDWRPRDLVRRIGSVFQDPRHQIVTASVREELALGPRRIGMSEDRITRRVDELMERLRLDRLALANPYTLSGGEQRRLSVATALATAPRVLTLDEPTFGQDALTWAELVALLRELLDQGAAVVSATHDAAFVDQIAATVVTVGDGRARASASTDGSRR